MVDYPESLPPVGPLEAGRSDDDLKVLNEVLAAFGRLKPDRREKILSIVATYYGVKAPEAISVLAAPHHGDATRSEPSFSEDRSISPKQFMLEKQPKTDVERVACLAYYLTHYRGIQNFNALDVSKLNTEAAQVKFADASVALANATKLNYLAPAGKGAKQLSALGEQFVLALPDRDRARNIMASARPRRKRRKANEEQSGDETQ